MPKRADAASASVALRQKVAGKYASLTTDQLHRETLNARKAFFDKCVGAQSYAIDVLLPYCQEIIRRYKMQGVAAKDRPNSKPTVDAYFKSIGLNYNTVRSWIYRKTLQTEMFQSKRQNSWNRDGKSPHLTTLEARLLGTASAGHDLVKAIRLGANVEEAIKEFEDNAPAPERVEEYIERPVTVVASEAEKLAVRLCKLIERNAGKQEQKILALARELLGKLEPATLQQALGKLTA
jgi:hypothetical protein